MRLRALAFLSAAALFMLGAIPAQAGKEDRPYLAIGDSVAFGFSPLLNLNNASNFIGYPEIVAKRLDLRDVNAACSGEATGGFISPTGLDNSCRAYRAAFPLHVSYSGTQLAFAVNFLKHHRNTRLVTLGLDANDFFRLSTGPGTPWPPSTCFVPAPANTAGLVTYFSTCAVQNLTTILSAVRGSAHYRGDLVIVLYYALNYSDPASLFVTRDLLNKAMITAATPFKVRFASGFDAFQAAAAPFGGDSCKAGLLIVVKASPLTCDVHPTPAGRDLLAGAVVKAVGDDD
ncbi:MAG TPA: GDSL-type esterase/lipase family protein [Candidatus Dormibacteraeota bacterium]|nr:GDSL-type esterase/lipase family protein [Candidatus Dormibacteraeota bacterium]